MLFVWTVIANLHNRRSELTLMVEKTFATEGIRIPDSSLAREMHPGHRPGDGRRRDGRARGYAEYSDAEREAVVHAHPRTVHFKEDTIRSSFDGIKHKLETSFVNADVLADKDPHC